jgi:hypothetical protein
MTPVLDAARRELQRGRQPIPIPLGKKGPVLQAWQTLRYSEEDLPNYFGLPSNLGILNGEPSSNHIDLDLDCPEAVKLADVFLPSTHSVFGRMGKPRSHRTYIADPLIPTIQFRDSDGSILLEVRSTGSQTVIPPSTHPSGELILWDEDGDPARVDGNYLLDQAGTLAAACILVRHYPEHGGRHDAALALAGGLTRLEWSEEDVASFIEIVAQAADDEETRDRAKAASYTAARLAAGHTATGWNRLRQLVGEDVVDRVWRWLGATKSNANLDTGPFIATSDGIIYRRQTQKGTFDQVLSNFSARIVEEVIADDGVNERGELVIDGTLAGGIMLPRISVPRNQFTALEWPFRKWGTRAIVTAGMGTKDRLREAIQRLSPEVPQRRVYEHPGWRDIPDLGWCFLHADGAISTQGGIAGVDVDLSGIAANIILPNPPEGAQLREAVRACLALLELAPDLIMARLLGGVYRSILCEFAPVDLSIFLVGPSGVYKSELGGLAMQHVGAGFDRLHLPATWTGTPNYLEGMCFRFKDVPVVIDDFAPSGSSTDIARLHATADRVLRAVGNRGGRGRMNADGSLRPDLPPRGLVIGTGEDAPKGHSLRARMDIVEVGPGDVNLDLLTEAQAAGRNGLFVAGLAGFIQWIAIYVDDVRQQVPQLLADLRGRAQQQAVHARTPNAVANLALGWSVFLDFAVDVEAVTYHEAEVLRARVWQALGEAAASQARHQVSEEPARRFIDLLGSALSGGFTHVAEPTGGVPNNPEAWGWRESTVGTGEYERIEWRPQGTRAGWTDGENLYLDLEAALTAVQKVGQATGSPIGVSATTLAKRLQQRGFLRSSNEKQGELKVRRTLEGRRRHVLHLAASTITLEETSQSGHSNQRKVEDTA